jgi:hypothetical protein
MGESSETRILIEVAAAQSFFEDGLDLQLWRQVVDGCGLCSAWTDVLPWVSVQQ